MLDVVTDPLTSTYGNLVSMINIRFDKKFPVSKD